MIPSGRTLPPQAWRSAPETSAVLAALGPGNGRFVGGCVRNALLGVEVEDVDIATPLAPDAVMAKLAAAGLKAIPTGIAHGTVTALSGGRAFEITTLRHDVETDGRRAVVAYTDDWAADAARRDFTINALFADGDGAVYDPVGGLADLDARRVRFIGDPGARIAEDYLRILRFFRIHAWYGRGEPDGAALRACAAAKDGLRRLSGERIAHELLRLLAADDPAPALRLMAASGVLEEILPERLDMTRFGRLVEIETTLLFACDAELRLGALLVSADSAATAAARFKASNALRDRLTAMHGTAAKIVPYLSIREVRRLLYRIGPAVFKDLAMLRWAEDPKASNAPQWRALLALADAWERPQLPLSGADVMAAGVPHGPQIGRILAEVEEWWIDTDFTDDRFSLIERLKAVVQAS